MKSLSLFEEVIVLLLEPEANSVIYAVLVGSARLMDW
jgi:hypothetical protein